jgi:hypothetical protein
MLNVAHGNGVPLAVPSLGMAEIQELRTALARIMRRL